MSLLSHTWHFSPAKHSSTQHVTEKEISMCEKSNTVVLKVAYINWWKEQSYKFRRYSFYTIHNYHPSFNIRTSKGPRALTPTNKLRKSGCQFSYWLKLKFPVTRVTWFRKFNCELWNEIPCYSELNYFNAPSFTTRNNNNGDGLNILSKTTHLNLSIINGRNSSISKLVF